MTSRLIFGLPLLAASFTSLYAGTNQWTNLGPEGGPVGRMVIDPQNPGTIYASANSRLFKSTNGGASWNWTPVSSDLSTSPYITTLAIDPQKPGTVYAGAIGSVLKTTDGGMTWNAVSLNLPGDPPVFSLAVDSQHTSTLYAGTSFGLVKSTDGARVGMS